MEAKREELDEAQRADSAAGLVSKPTAEHVVCRLAVCYLKHDELVRLVESALELAAHWHGQGHDRRAEPNDQLETTLREVYEEIVAEVSLEILKGEECRRFFELPTECPALAGGGEGYPPELVLRIASETAGVSIWALPKFAGCFVPAEIAS
ncbi:MAG: hypothetical protein Q8M92_02345, partial [Candidatus Subteraquimicrobiales bacterium]|nr:hypothetical protein [Candidatus Subteraquimicrobiales bacterium]